MQYVACLRVGQNDVKALINLEVPRRDVVAPLLDMRGDDDRHLQTFLTNWTEHPFFLDVSRVTKDVAEVFITTHDLHNPNGAFENKRRFFMDVAGINQNVIPVISWVDDDPQRAVIQSALALQGNFEHIAIRVTCPENATATSWSRLLSILDALESPEAATVILDFGATSPANTASGSDFNLSLRQLNSYQIRKLVLVSTSFPIDKPASNSSRSSACYDVAWQSRVDMSGIESHIIYGDYAATNPTAPMEYVPGMPVLPFGCYYTPTEWWQRRKGANKEFVKYVEIAQEIKNLPGYHGDEFCWATREYSRIVATSTNYGNNGTWNGYRINQHICAMIQSIVDADNDFDDLDPDDLL
ncbi:beta family protein [Pseudomonas syringae]|uniref:Beta protein n=1 Tax=Pseudomonas syringae pv. pisi TaxID=59510 RepID=A0A3M3U3G3_PSESJ|nr:hypothetical protein [Pseudomonas syringae]PYD29613.1 hypothetical protein DND67_15555 [Pseudomonas syringae pv. pisi]RMO27656.1 hypothetical protein ALQ44_02877 [Pseudomonas syringae pv. pisi]